MVFILAFDGDVDADVDGIVIVIADAVEVVDGSVVFLGNGESFACSMKCRGGERSGA